MQPRRLLLGQAELELVVGLTVQLRRDHVGKPNILFLSILRARVQRHAAVVGRLVQR